MLAHLDRVQVVVSERRSAVAAYTRLVDAAVVREDAVRRVGARRTVLQVGNSEIELLEPDGAGPVADCLARGGGVFAAGFATPDMARLRAHLATRGVEGTLSDDGTQLYLAPDTLGVPGLRAVVSTATERPAVGALRHLYEATLLVADSGAAVGQVATLFGLDASHFVSIRSAQYGYDGTLTLFHPERLDRMEIITPSDPAKTMGRFFAKRGPSWYMCFAEADDLRPIRARLMEHAPEQWTGPRDSETVDSLFIHPPALGGMMLGISRTRFAWVWSGHPDWVRPEAHA